MANLGLLNPGNAQYYQTSGEATQQQKLPEQFRSMNVQSSPLSASTRVPPDWIPAGSTRRAPVVQRRPRMNGIWHLYSRTMQRQPYENMGAPGGTPQNPYVSAFNPNDMGPIRNGGFNNALYQAGYPGFNLGLSFKVPRVVAPQEGRANAGLSQGGPITVSQSRNVRTLRRPSGNPPRS